MCSLYKSRLGKLPVKSLFNGTAENVSFEILKIGVNCTISSKLENAQANSVNSHPQFLGDQEFHLCMSGCPWFSDLGTEVIRFSPDLPSGRS